MVSPFLFTGIIKSNQSARVRVKGTDIGPLITVATHAGKRKIIQPILAAMLNRDNVVRFVPVKRQRLRQ